MIYGYGLNDQIWSNPDKIIEGLLYYSVLYMIYALVSHSSMLCGYCRSL